MSAALRALSVLLGLVLLLPGLCSMTFIVAFALEALQGARDPYVIGLLVPLGLLWAVTFLLAWGGVALLRRTARQTP
jgi:hypothetical protein